MFIDVDCSQIKKFGQNAYGDYFASQRTDNQERVIAVLSDGLGSGVKANILSCMTATMMLRFIEEDVPIQKAAQIIMNALPVCQVRKISYATFSAVDCRQDGTVRIVEEGNPAFVWMRGKTEMTADYREWTSPNFPDRHLRLYQFQVALGDRLVFCSDGVTQAGLGTPVYPLGWQRSGLITFLTDTITQDPDISSTALSEAVIRRAQTTEEHEQAGDDISCAVLYFRTPRRALIFTGPPYDKMNDAEYCRLFDSFTGKKAICGGTTANLIARELKRDITTPDEVGAGNLPPIAYMPGVDLVTEGILTLTRALDYLEHQELAHNDAAGALVVFLLDSDVIEFMVGATVNQAHYDPSFPIEIEIRRNIIKKMKTVLEDKYFKQAIIHYI